MGKNLRNGSLPLEDYREPAAAGRTPSRGTDRSCRTVWKTARFHPGTSFRTHRDRPACGDRRTFARQTFPQLLARFLHPSQIVSAKGTGGSGGALSAWFDVVGPRNLRASPVQQRILFLKLFPPLHRFFANCLPPDESLRADHFIFPASRKAHSRFNRHAVVIRVPLFILEKSGCCARI